jgi:hypothetical protein
MFYCFNSYSKVPACCERKAARCQRHNQFQFCSLLQSAECTSTADCFAPAKGAFEVTLKGLLLSFFMLLRKDALDAMMK